MLKSLEAAICETRADGGHEQQESGSALQFAVATHSLMKGRGRMDLLY
jgi:hypothetical protein